MAPTQKLLLAPRATIRDNTVYGILVKAASVMRDQ